ncbi:MAG TPA: hypothetical protein VK623_01110 [Flavobacterium sp.]|nr:hypothetical protein [Flavobacterium sp.]
MDLNKRDYRIRYENDNQYDENSSEQNIFINPDRNADWIKRAEAGEFEPLESDETEDEPRDDQ